MFYESLDDLLLDVLKSFFTECREFFVMMYCFVL